MTKLLFLISLFSFSATSFAAGDIKTFCKLNAGDSAQLEGLHISPYTQQTDTDGWQTLSSNYATSDDAFKIECTVRNIMGQLTNQSCSVSIDSSLSLPDSTQIAVGTIGNVIWVKILGSADISRLSSILNPMPFFQTLEKVKITLPNGKIAEYEKFRIDCDVSAKTCSADLFP